jgi:VPDSG-CTERM motif
MKLYLICVLAAVALALNAEATPKDKEKDKPPIIIIDKVKDKGGPVYSVPDTGSTALLLGTAVLILGIASRRFATR